MAKNKKVIIRSPYSTRPWQHVLDVIFGYLKLAIKLKNNSKLNGEAFNFGPDKNKIKVIDVEIENKEENNNPDFCDAYISEAKFTNGKSLDDEQLVELQEQNLDEFSELVLDEFLSYGDY